EGALRLGHGGLHLLLLGHVGREHQGLPASRLDRGLGLLGRGLVHVDEAHPGPFPRQLDRGSPADAEAGAGDDGPPSLQPAAHGYPTVRSISTSPSPSAAPAVRIQSSLPRARMYTRTPTPPSSHRPSTRGAHLYGDAGNGWKDFTVA